MRPVFWGAVAAAVLAIALAALLALAWPVMAHDHWISRNPVTAWCCNREDCRVLLDGEAVQSKGGWRVNGHPVSPHHVYPVTAPNPSEAARFHACFKPGGGVRCLFVPAMF